MSIPRGTWTLVSWLCVLVSHILCLCSLSDREFDRVSLVSPDYGELYRWVEMNRYQYKKMKEGRRPCSMTLQRVELLEEIDFVWDARDAAWYGRLRELEEYVHVNGLGQLPPVKTHGSLRHWLRRQVQLYDEKKDGEQVSLTEERIAQLKRLGFLLD